jgi:pantothenate kinase
MVTLRVSAGGAELDDLVREVAARSAGGGRVVLGVAGAPGSGKSTLATALAERGGETWAVAPMDGFHLADTELRRQGLLDRKGAPETFDAWGYAALLARLRAEPHEVVYAPAFERDLEQPLAGAIGVPPSAELVVTEGNYLLLDRPEWRAVRDQLDEVWFLETDDAVRRERLLARHVRFGKSEAETIAWMAAVDDPNAVLVAACRERADRIVHV